MGRRIPPEASVSKQKNQFKQKIIHVFLSLFVGIAVRERKGDHMSDVPSTIVNSLEHIENTLMVIFEQQQHLASGVLPYVEERRLYASQLQLILQVKSAVQMARLATWSLIVPEAPEVELPLHEIKCEPVTEEEEGGISPLSGEVHSDGTCVW